MASKQKFLTDEQALAGLTDAVQTIKQVTDGLPNLGVYANVKVDMAQAVDAAKNAMTKLVARI